MSRSDRVLTQQWGGGYTSTLKTTASDISRDDINREQMETLRRSSHAPRRKRFPVDFTRAETFQG